MRSIKKRFEALKKKNPGHGDYVNLENAVKGQGYIRDTVGRNFTELVPKGEYAKKDRETLIGQLMVHTNCTEGNVSKEVKASRKRAKKKVVELSKEELVEPLRKNIKNNYYGEKD